MDLEDVVDNNFDNYLELIKEEKESYHNREIELLRIIWEPSLKKI
jgi:hypothetical protein